jgi:hypothetical protein
VDNIAPIFRMGVCTIVSAKQFCGEFPLPECHVS